MSLNTTPQTVTAAEYERIFQLERQQAYPMVDAFEDRMGHRMPRVWLEDLAQVLSCPVKAVPPNWQHGRVLFAAASNYAERHAGPFRCLDVGTAKGFSAICAFIGITGNGSKAHMTSVDVMPPTARVRRNTIAEVDGLKTLPEILAGFPEGGVINFIESTGIEWLKRGNDRIHFAFIDGKHTDDAVYQEGKLLAARQELGDVAIFDDVHMPGVGAAVAKLAGYYELEYLQVLPKRKYAIGVRK
jgi:predicted O-methyltransferase YrrM